MHITSVGQLYFDATRLANPPQEGLAANSSSVNPDDRDFQSDFVTSFKGFNTNMDGFSTALADSTSAGPGTPDKGLANYDSTNDLETLLKNVVDLNKNALTSIDQALGGLPLLGPLLGPCMVF